ncbi:FHA domain-containing protein [bacterium]|nr:FHA domain-containing protein [bacterium]
MSRLFKLWGMMIFMAVARDVGAQTPEASNSGSALKRTLQIRSKEVFEKRMLRLFVIFDEADSEGRYLLNTLDARSFRLFAKEANEAPLDVRSLGTVATRSPPVPRETAIVFESQSDLGQQQSEAIRKAVASFLGGFRSDVLSVRMGNEDNVNRLAWISPGHSENPRAIQRAILDAPVLAGSRGLTSAVCSAVADLDVVPERNGGMGVQRNLIVVSTDNAEENIRFSELGRCFSDAVKRSTRVFWLAIKTQSATPSVSKLSRVVSAAVEKSAGFVAHVAPSVDPSSALNNIRSYLDDEYVLEFDVTAIKPYSDNIDFELSANYHGHVVKSGFFRAEGFVAQPTPEELERAAQLAESAKRKDLSTIVLVVGLLSLTGGFFWVQLRRKIHVCGDCSFVVARTFQDCPFRNEKCYGRLSVIHGPAIGSVFPLFSGENLIGAKRTSPIRLKGGGIAREHAKIVLSKRKALFVPSKGGTNRVNGVLTTEPRLLGSGTVVRMGDYICRVDFKEGE